MSSPIVSVILPSYNRRHTLPGAICSVLNQSFTDLELIVVDDGSSDGTAEFISEWSDPRLRFIRLDRNQGVSAARNAGIQAARGQFLAFQDSDDEWLLDKLSLQLQHLRSSGCQAAICGTLRRHNEKISETLANICKGKSRLGHEDALTTYSTYTQAWLLERQVLAAVGVFDTRMTVWEDWELMIRISRMTDVAILEKTLVISGRSEDSLSVQSPDWTRNLQHILQKHDENLGAWPKQRGRLHHVLARQYTADQHWSYAREQLILGLRSYPWDLKRWVLLAVCYLPTVAHRVLN